VLRKSSRPVRIDVAFVCELINKHLIVLKHVPSFNNLADVLNKSIPAGRFADQRLFIGAIPFTSSDPKVGGLIVNTAYSKK
jgi:hypothetical protein